MKQPMVRFLIKNQLKSVFQWWTPHRENLYFFVGMILAIPSNLGLFLGIIEGGWSSPIFIPYMTHNGTVVCFRSCVARFCSSNFWQDTRKVSRSNSTLNIYKKLISRCTTLCQWPALQNTTVCFLVRTLSRHRWQFCSTRCAIQSCFGAFTVLARRPIYCKTTRTRTNNKLNGDWRLPGVSCVSVRRDLGEFNSFVSFWFIITRHSEFTCVSPHSTY